MKRRVATYVAYVDVLLLLVCFTLLAVNIPSQQKQEVGRTNALYTVWVVWDTGMDVDVDVWLRLPDDSNIGYSRKSNGSITLERDDLGTILSEGNLNLEIVKIREPVKDGMYGISVHTYSSRSDKRSEGKILVEITDAEGSVVFTRTVPMPPVRRQTGIVVFELDDGQIRNPKDTELTFRR